MSTRVLQTKRGPNWLRDFDAAPVDTNLARELADSLEGGGDGFEPHRQCLRDMARELDDIRRAALSIDEMDYEPEDV